MLALTCKWKLAWTTIDSGTTILSPIHIKNKTKPLLSQRIKRKRKKVDWHLTRFSLFRVSSVKDTSSQPAVLSQKSMHVHLFNKLLIISCWKSASLTRVKLHLAPQKKHHPQPILIYIYIYHHPQPILIYISHWFSPSSSIRSEFNSG